MPFERASIEQKPFLPGLHLHHGVLQIDLDKLAFAGDILREAGHIAVCESQERQFLHGDIYKNGLLNGRESQRMHGEEMVATAWALAAVTHLELPLNIVFHEEGYRGGSNSLMATSGLTAWDQLAKAITHVSKLKTEYEEHVRGILGHMNVMSGSFGIDLSEISYRVIKFCFVRLVRRLNGYVRNALNLVE